MTKIAVLVGSLRKDSVNKKLAHALEALLPEGVEFIHGDINLPLYDNDLENTQYPEAATTLKRQVSEADGVLIISPEYNRGMPGVLKNAIDWLSRPSAENPFHHKPVVIAGVSGGPIGTAVAQSQLRGVMIYLNAKLQGQPEFYGMASRLFDDSGELHEESKEFVQSFLNALIAHTQSA